MKNKITKTKIIKKYPEYSFYSSKLDSYYGCYPTKSIAEQNILEAREELSLNGLSTKIELHCEMLTHEELIESRSYEVLEYYELSETLEIK